MRWLGFRLRIRRLFIGICLCTLLLTVSFGQLKNSHIAAHATDAQKDTQADAQTTHLATAAVELVKTGVNSYQVGDFAAAIEPWQAAYEIYKAETDFASLAIVSENLARAYQQMGQTTAEIEYWQQAIAATQPLDNPIKLGRLLSEQAQAYSRLGQHRRAIALLCGRETTPCLPGTALAIAQSEADNIGEIAALGSLGEAYRFSGDTETALSYLNQGRLVSEAVGDPVLKAALFNSLGNTSVSLALVDYRRAAEADNNGDQSAAASFSADAKAHNAEAISAFQQSYALADVQADGAAQVRSLLNLIPAYERADESTSAEQTRITALQVLQSLPSSQTKAFALIQLADLLDPLEVRQFQSVLTRTPSAAEAEATDLLNQALAVGEAINNPRVVSFAMGKLGQLDERAGRYQEALEKTQEARLAADQDLAARDSLYLWEWQSGRILEKQGKSEAAEQAYRQAVELLEQIRSDILNANRDVQFDFRDTVEPIYRQYAELNLQGVPSNVPLQVGEPAFAELDTALITLDSLKVAELQSYFANDCVIIPSETRVDEVGDSPATAVISTAILGESLPVADGQGVQQLAVILSLPDGRKKISQTVVSETEFTTQIRAFRRTLEAGIREYMSEYDYGPSQQLYDWLVDPFEAELDGVETLVFVNDGLLRNVPMAALYDGEQYLIEQFAIATTPSLTLTDPERIERPTQLSALLMGVSEQPTVPGRFFQALPAVETELEKVSAQLPNHTILKNQDFSLAGLQQALNARDYRILHMATHGTFGFDPDDNFLVTGAKRAGEAEAGETSEVSETLTISKLDELIREVNDPTREAIELLTLTACETAIGDNRSTLGLAGVAIRAGVRSAIATLWSVSDESSAQLIAQFYDNLQNPDFTKAQALQQAQVNMLRSGDAINEHPYRWAPFTLIGNWL